MSVEERRKLEASERIEHLNQLSKDIKEANPTPPPKLPKSTLKDDEEDEGDQPLDGKSIPGPISGAPIIKSKPADETPPPQADAKFKVTHDEDMPDALIFDGDEGTPTPTPASKFKKQ